MSAAKALFADRGYEQTSTSAIARRAGTSESQLVRYFATKRGLLGAIFDESWRSLNEQIEHAVASQDDPITALRLVLLRIIGEFDRDPELAHLFLFEARRIRGKDFELSGGYVDFVQFLQRLIRRAQKTGAFAQHVDAGALCSALVGAAEGMMRDRIIAAGSRRGQPFSKQQVHRVFSALLDGLGGRSRRARR